MMRRVLAAALAVSVLAVACSKEEAPGGASRIVAQLASADLYVGTPQRVLVGMFADDGRLVTSGTVRMRFAYLGTEDAPTDPQPGPEADATYIPTPGTPAGGGAVTLSDPAEARGVYQAVGVEFDRAGLWQVTVEADVEGLGRQTAQSAFPVTGEPQILAPGDEALRTENLTLDSKGVPKAAIDSLSAAGGPIQDPELHRWTFAEALDEGLPIVAVFGTPAYCVSRFCGPVIEAVEGLEEDHGDSVAFIHVEIWRDYEKQKINEAATDWLQTPDGGLSEPWLYLIDGDGTILDRWGALWDPDEVAAAIDRVA